MRRILTIIASAIFILVMHVYFLPARAGVVPAASEDDATAECIPVDAMEAIIKSLPTFGGMRLVPDEKLPLALRLYRKGTQDMRPWTLIYLVDSTADGDGGIMLVGVDGFICKWVVVPSKSWKFINQMLNGDPA